MTTANTHLLIKRSTVTATPTGLMAGELAYSYLSNTMFIGDSTGTMVANVGGLFYTSQIDAATDANTASTIVRRDANGAFYGRLYGNANTATALLNARNFSVSGDASTASGVSFDGTGDVDLAITLATVNSNVGTYGGASQGSTSIPVITVNEKGLITAVSNVSATSSFTISDGSSSNTVYSGSTLTFAGEKGITASVNATTETVTFGTNEYVLRSNTTMADVGTQTIGTDLNITGNLTVTGTTTTVDSTVIVAENSLIELAANNTTGDVIDIGFYGNHSGGSITGLVRDASTKDYYLFDNVSVSDLDAAANVITSGALAAGLTTLHTNITAATANISTANVTTANVSAGMTVAGGLYADSLTLSTGLTAPSITDSGLTATRITFAGTGGLLSDSSALTTDGTTLTVGGLSTTGTIHAGDTTASTLTANNLTATRMTFAGVGGELTDSSSITTDGTTITAGGFTTTGSVSASSVTDSGLTSGRVTYAGTGGLLSDSSAFTFNAGTGALSVTSLTLSSALTVPNGGTGNTSFTSQGIIYGNGTDALQVTAAAGSADQHYSNQLLTVDNSGNPIWTDTLDAGEF